MKITDFGLWFLGSNDSWSTTIPKEDGFHIYYDGVCLGLQYPGFSIEIWEARPHIISLKKHFRLFGFVYRVGRQLTFDDFEIVPNPDCNWDIFKGVL